MDIIFVYVGYFIRLAFVYKFNVKRMNKKYKSDPVNEEYKNIHTGLIFMIFALIITALNQFL